MSADANSGRQRSHKKNFFKKSNFKKKKLKRQNFCSELPDRFHKILKIAVKFNSVLKYLLFLIFSVLFIFSRIR
jgi:hypothetical protein